MHYEHSVIHEPCTLCAIRQVDVDRCASISSQISATLPGVSTVEEWCFSWFVTLPISSNFAINRRIDEFGGSGVSEKEMCNSPLTMLHNFILK